MEDVYVILTAVEADGSATIKIYRNPLVNWIWVGSIIFALGGIAILWPHPVRPTPLQQDGMNATSRSEQASCA